MVTIPILWTRIEEWYRHNVPAGHFRTNGPASPDQIKAAEASLELTLPQDVIETYLIHNGSTSPVFPYGYNLSTLDEMKKDWSSWMAGEPEAHKLLEVLDPIELIQRDYFWHPRWVPIATNQSGDHDILDLAPAAGGTIGQIIDFSHEVGACRVVASSWRDHLQQLVDGLESGKYHWEENGWWITPGE
ncbi:MAG: SMI1/KNR4 family protein [Phycisphaeraceae bacterium]